jgi:hypothetical protein
MKNLDMDGNTSTTVLKSIGYIHILAEKIKSEGD